MSSTQPLPEPSRAVYSRNGSMVSPQSTPPVLSTTTASGAERDRVADGAAGDLDDHAAGAAAGPVGDAGVRAGGVVDGGRGPGEGDPGTEQGERRDDDGRRPDDSRGSIAARRAPTGSERRRARSGATVEAPRVDERGADRGAES